MAKRASTFKAHLVGAPLILRRRGISVGELTRSATDSAAGEPTDTEVEAFYLARPEQAQRKTVDK